MEIRLTLFVSFSCLSSLVALYMYEVFFLYHMSSFFNYWMHWKVFFSNAERTSQLFFKNVSILQIQWDISRWDYQMCRHYTGQLHCQKEVSLVEFFEHRVERWTSVAWLCNTRVVVTCTRDGMAQCTMNWWLLLLHMFLCVGGHATTAAVCRESKDLWEPLFVMYMICGWHMHVCDSDK